MSCPWCGRDVPPGTYCVRCGTNLGGSSRGERPSSARRHFAAAPHERLASPRVISTLFPHLPRSDMAPFRVVLVGGLALIAGLAAFRLFPVALVAAAILVPLLTVLYLYEVDLYEDEPLLVVALTMAWGAVAGVTLAVVTRTLSPSGVGLLLASKGSTALGRGVLAPLAALALSMAGPLVLLFHRKFNDVLDGATFGAATAVALAGAQALTQGVELLGSGTRPVGQTVPWTFRLLSLGVAVPVLAACAVGAAMAALWLRYRAPVADRMALGRLGRPTMAVGFAGVVFVAAGLLQVFLSPVPAFLALLPLDLAALAGLRRAIHVGLLEEANEIALGPEIDCPNCGRRTVRHSFCGHCGIALRALPKGRTR